MPKRTRYVSCPLCGRKISESRFKTHYRSESCLWWSERRIEDELKRGERPESLAAALWNHVYISVIPSSNFKERRQPYVGLPVIGWEGEPWDSLHLDEGGHFEGDLYVDNLDLKRSINKKIIKQILSRQLRFTKADNPISAKISRSVSKTFAEKRRFKEVLESV